MLIKTILFKNNLIKRIKSKNFFKTKKKFLELKKDYEENYPDETCPNHFLDGFTIGELQPFIMFLINELNICWVDLTKLEFWQVLIPT